MINIIACVASNNAIGFENELLFHIKNDMKRFKELTTNNVVIMGRKTFDSLPKGKLPNRINVVVSTQDFFIKGVDVVHSLEEALEKYKNNEIYIIGGASIYEQAMKYADRLFMTEVDAYTIFADKYFPDYKKTNEWEETYREKIFDGTYQYSFVTYKRKPTS